MTEKSVSRSSFWVKLMRTVAYVTIICGYGKRPADHPQANGQKAVTLLRLDRARDQSGLKNETK